MHMNPALWNGLTEEERTEIGTGHGAFIDTIKKSGELITTQALADPSQSAVSGSAASRRPSPTGPTSKPRSTSAAST